ncbi:hypothetical protein [Brevundimonas vesicularis]|uniref:hypothetical protein n=1 Tax=Brevundimonas vesicularis TaxID=41276 RepID=UPI00082C519F|nr:hypothetical protein [Brevundimonas vesicularis]
MRMIDTQILINMQAGRRPPVMLGAVASVSAFEFLKAYSKDPQRARYYVPLRLGFHALVGSPEQAPSPTHSSRRNRTDRLLIDLGGDHKPIVEYGSLAVTQAINSGRPEIFNAAVEGLGKADERELRQRFRFLLDRGFRGFALEPEAAGLGLEILDVLLTSHAPKANFVNTVRDCLILGVAVKHGVPLQTEDKLLARLAAQHFAASTHLEGDDLILDFSAGPTDRKHLREESKGYIHRGWRIAENRIRTP